MSWTDRTVSTAAPGADSVFAADLDGDGDLDVLAAHAGAATVAWHESADGSGTLWAQTAIATDVIVPQSVFAADLDGDGDLDGVSASFADDSVAWYENVAGDGLLWTEHLTRASRTTRAASSAPTSTATPTRCLRPSWGTPSTGTRT